MSDNPEVGAMAETCGYRTNYHDRGAGPAMLVLHGSGAGVCAWANWRTFIPALEDRFRIIAPDLVGFGYTETPADYPFRFMDSWVEQQIALLDALGIEKTHVVGNSFGGSLALWLAWKHPDRIDRMVLMGPGGWPALVNANLELLWDFEPTAEHMRKAMSVMAWNQDLITDDLVAMRLKACQRPGALDHFKRLFPPPRQRWLDAQCLPIGALQGIDHDVLIVHGRDDRVVDPQVSWNLHQHLRNSQLHLIGNCGHWTMIEQGVRFRRLVADHFLEAG
ncbi:MAG: alpha/beta fold hydrolase [Novosphingobium sp.]